MFAQTSHEFDWARNFGLTGSNTWSQQGMVMDAAGNIIFTGDFSGNMDLDPGSGVQMVSTSGLQDRDFLVIKLNNDGNYLWGLHCGLSGASQQSSSISTDASGNIYVVGYFNTSCQFGGIQLTSAGNKDGFLMKIDPYGVIQWVKQFGGTGLDDLERVFVDNAGYICVGGQFTGTVDMDPGSAVYNLTSTLATAPSTYASDAFLLRLTPAGDFVWAGCMGGIKGMNVICISGYTDANGHWDIYAGGSIPGAVCDLDPGVGYYPVTGTNTNSLGDAYEIRVYDGNLVWAKVSGGSIGEENTYAIIPDGAGSVFTLKNINQYLTKPKPLARLQKLNSSNGAVVYTREIILVSGTSVSSRAMTRDAAGNIYIVGTLNGKADFDPSSATYYLEAPTTEGTFETFLLKLNASGNFQWAKKTSGSWGVGFMEVCMDPAENLILLAVCESNMGDYDPGTGNYCLISEGDAYAVVRYRNMSAVGCLPPLAVNAYDIKTDNLKIGWQSVAGAGAYNLQYRLVGNPTWTTSSGVTSPVTINSLVSGARYEYQVQSVCSGTPGNWSTIRDVVTATCMDLYEANETLANAKLISTNTPVTERLGSFGDVDWYKFNNTNTLKCIHVELTNYLPAFRVQLYKSTGTLLAPIQQYGVSYSFDYTKAAAGTYYIKVSALNGTFDPNKCYNLLVNIYACSKSASSTLELEDLMIYPNPASYELNVDFDATEQGVVKVSLYDMMGRLVRCLDDLVSPGANGVLMDVSDIPAGMYLVEVRCGDGRSVEKVSITK